MFDVNGNPDQDLIEAYAKSQVVSRTEAATSLRRAWTSAELMDADEIASALFWRIDGLEAAYHQFTN